MKRFLGACCGIVAAALCAGVALPAVAQQIDELKAQHEANQRDYRDLVEQISLTQERVASIGKEVDALRKDNATLTAALVKAAASERKLSEQAADITERLDVLGKQEADARASLMSRRGALAEVLGALERMGLNPPPAILVRPDDALASVRSAILLGSVVPELKERTEILAADLKELTRVRASIEEERGRLLDTVRNQQEEKQRLSLLLDAKARLQRDSEAQLAAEQKRAAELADKASTLQDLIASLETDIAAARKAKDAALARAEGPVPEANRLRSAVPFPATQGQLVLPVAGSFGPRFGEDDGTGRPLKGDMVRTQSGAIVTSPADGTVVYAGPFRSYGQLLILNAGDGYHVVLAGMERISVSLGQSVISGEPVGAMGETRLASAAAFDGADDAPELYIEFRKDGTPVDPSLWWAKSNSGRTANDS